MRISFFIKIYQEYFLQITEYFMNILMATFDEEKAYVSEFQEILYPVKGFSLVWPVTR